MAIRRDAPGLESRLTPRERNQLAGHVAQERIARLAQVAAGAAGLIGAAWHGVASILLGVAGVWFFGQARPGPSAELDKLTGRDSD